MYINKGALSRVLCLHPFFSLLVAWEPFSINVGRSGLKVPNHRVKQCLKPLWCIHSTHLLLKKLGLERPGIFQNSRTFCISVPKCVTYPLGSWITGITVLLLCCTPPWALAAGKDSLKIETNKQKIKKCCSSNTISYYLNNGDPWLFIWLKFPWSAVFVPFIALTNSTNVVPFVPCFSVYNLYQRAYEKNLYKESLTFFSQATIWVICLILPLIPIYQW